MKIYYFLSSLSKQAFDEIISKVGLISNGETPASLIDKHYQKMGKYQPGAIQEADFLEVLSSIEYLHQQNNLSYREILQKIEWIWDQNFFLYNEELYIQASSRITQIDYSQQEVLFITARDSFQAPFFLILTQIAKTSKHLKIIKINSRIDRWMYCDKLFYISRLFERRKDFFGDLAIPMFLNCTPSLVRGFFEFVGARMGNKVLVKQNFFEMGLGVRALDLQELWDDRLEYFIEKFLPKKPMNIHGIYVLPFMEIKKEYRIYYTLQGKMVNIYSVKNRKNVVNESLFHKSSFSIYKNISVTWDYMKPEDLGKREIDFIRKICIRCLDKCGVLEFFEDSLGKLHFCEINFLGGSLMFEGPDQENMLNYYVDAYALYDKEIAHTTS